MELIDKAAIVAEIEKRIKEIDEIGTYLSPKGVLTNLLCHLDTFVVKDVDLDEEIDKWYDTASDEFEKIHFEHIENCAKHFFELGLKAKEGKE